MSWFRPAAGLVAGLFVLAYSLLAYNGHALVRALPAVLRREGDALWLAGAVLLSAGLGLGVAGLLMHLNLRVPRIVLIVLGVVLLVLAGRGRAG